MILRMMRYDPVAMYVPGKELLPADALKTAQLVVTAVVCDLIQEVEA